MPRTQHSCAQAAGYAMQQLSRACTVFGSVAARRGPSKANSESIHGPSLVSPGSTRRFIGGRSAVDPVSMGCRSSVGTAVDQGSDSIGGRSGVDPGQVSGRPEGRSGVPIGLRFEVGSGSVPGRSESDLKLHSCPTVVQALLRNFLDGRWMPVGFGHLRGKLRSSPGSLGVTCRGARRVVVRHCS